MDPTTTAPWALPDSSTLATEEVSVDSIDGSPPPEVSVDFQFYSTPLLVTIGVICNFLSVCVFCGTGMRKTTSGHYLTALAVSDSLVLVGEFIKWLDSLRIGLPTISESAALCKLTYYLRYAGQLMSAFLVTTVSIERYIVVVHPLRAASVLSLKAARVNIALVTVAAALLGCYGGIFFTIMPMAFFPCGMAPDVYQTYQLTNLVISKVFGEIVTSVVVMALTLVILWHLAKSRRDRHKKLSVTKAGTTSQAEQQLTVMLVVVALAFVLLRAPYTMTYYIGLYGDHEAWFKLYPRARQTLSDALRTTYVINISNYAVNFFLYSVSGTRFREALVELFCRRLRSSGDGASISGKQPSELNMSGGSNALDTELKAKRYIAN